MNEPISAPVSDEAPDVATDMAEAMIAPLGPPARLVYVPGRNPDMDGPLHKILEKRAADLPIRIRMPLTVLHESTYVTWAGMSWLFEFRDAAAVIQFREALDAWLREWTSA